MKSLKPHRNLVAWQKSMDLVVKIYEMTGTSKEEMYSLTSQMRRAAISTPSNIAEGAADRSSDQFRNYLGIALGSLNELDTQLEIAKRLGYVEATSENQILPLMDECMALVYGLRKSIS